MRRTLSLTAPSIVLMALSALPASGALYPLANPSFESPALDAGNSWYGSVDGWGIAGPSPGTTYELPWNFPASDGVQYVWAQVTDFHLFQNVGTIQANTVYRFDIDIRRLPGTTGNFASVVFEDLSFTGFEAQANYHPPWNPTQEDFVLTETEWTTVTIGFAANDFPTKIGLDMRIRVEGTNLAIDNARVTYITQVPNTDYYISFSDGDDTNDGLNEATPWKTFTTVNSLSLLEGDRVLLKRGDTWANSKLNLRGKGTVANPIALTAYGTGPNPVITGINLTTEACIVLENPSNFIVSSMDCRDAKVGLYLRYTGGNSDGTGPGFNNENVTVQCCNFQNMDEVWSDGSGDITVPPPYELSWGAGIWLGGNIPNGSPPGSGADVATVVTNVTVRHCSFLDCSTGFGNNWYFPPRYKSRVRNLYLEDCFATGCENGGFAIFYVDGGHARRFDTLSGGLGFYSTGTTAGFAQDCRNFEISNCEFAFNNRIATGNDGTGFDFEGGCSNITFARNVVHDNDGGGLLILAALSDANSNLVVEDNTFYNNCRNPANSGQNYDIRYSDVPPASGLFQNNGIYRGSANAHGTPGIYDHEAEMIRDFGGAAVLATNRTGTDFSAVSGRPTAWEFNTDGDLEGWNSFNQWSGNTVSSGFLLGNSTGVDPFANASLTWFASPRNEVVRVRMRQSAGTFGQVFFRPETDTAFTGPKAAALTLIPDSQFHEYIVDLSTNSEYQGVIEELRLDPTDISGSDMAVDYVRVSPAPVPTTVTAASANSVDVTFNEQMHPNGGTIDPLNYTISGPGQGTLTANPSSVTPLCTPSGPVYRLTWDSGFTNGLDATVTFANMQDARGNAVLGGTATTFTTISAPAVSDWDVY